MTRPRAAVVDDHRVLWPALSPALTERGFDVVAEVVAIGELPAEAADIVVCDLHLAEGPDGPAAIAAIVQRGMRVLVLSGVAKQEEVLNAIEAGAVGFAEKSSHAAEIAEAAWAAVTDGCHVSARLAGFLLDDARRRSLPPTVELTERHRAVLRAVAQGDGTAEIAHSRKVPVAEVVEILWTALDRARRRRTRLRPKPGELEVMRLVACRGLSNHEIATLLHISPWTVTSRLESAREKYRRLCPETDPSRSPRDVARLWASELDLCRNAKHPNCAKHPN